MVAMAAVRQEEGMMAGEGIKSRQANRSRTSEYCHSLCDEKCTETRIPLMAATARLTHVYPSIT